MAEYEQLRKEVLYVTLKKIIIRIWEKNEIILWDEPWIKNKRLREEIIKGGEEKS